MSSDGKRQVEEFRARIQYKIQNLLNEFAEGKISREQFHAVYARYSGQLAIADYAEESGNVAAVDVAIAGPPTIMIKEEYSGKAIGMVIYHNQTGTFVETLGEFDVPVKKISPILNDYSDQMEANKLIDNKVVRISAKQWLLFAAGRYTTVVTQFVNEPSRYQIREIERLHHDFEQANRIALVRGKVNAARLAYPFLVFVQHKLKKP